MCRQCISKYISHRRCARHVQHARQRATFSVLRVSESVARGGLGQEIVRGGPVAKFLPIAVGFTENESKDAACTRWRLFVGAEEDLWRRAGMTLVGTA